MSDLKNIEEHNKAKLNLISGKLTAIENGLEKSINLLQTKIDTFIDNQLKETINELALLKVNIKLPISNISKNSLDILLYRNIFKPTEIKNKGHILKSICISFFLGIIIALTLNIYKMFSFGYLNIDILKSLSLKDIINTVMLPNVEISGSIILGIISAIFFIIFFVIMESIRKRKLKDNAILIEKELLEYEKEVNLRKYTYSDIDKFITDLDTQLDILIVLLDEENSKLKRINFMKDKYKRPDLKTIQDISRTQSLVEKIKELLLIELIDSENEVSLEAKEILKDSTEYINKHIKKIYKEEY